MLARGGDPSTRPQVALVDGSLLPMEGHGQLRTPIFL